MDPITSSSHTCRKLTDVAGGECQWEEQLEESKVRLIWSNDKTVRIFTTDDVIIGFYDDPCRLGATVPMGLSLQCTVLIL